MISDILVICESLELANPNDNWLLLGDYNLPNVTWRVDQFASTPDYNDVTTLRERNCGGILADTFNFLNLYQLNHIKNNKNVILDLIFSNSHEHIVEHVSDAIVSPDLYHPPLHVNYIGSNSPDSDTFADDWFLNYE